MIILLLLNNFSIIQGYLWNSIYAQRKIKLPQEIATHSKNRTFIIWRYIKAEYVF